MAEAARILNCDRTYPSAVYGAVRAKVEREALLGHAPGHFDSGTAPGYLMGKVTVQRNASGDVERTWERQSPEDQSQAILEAIDERAERIEPLPPVAIPETFGPDKLLNQVSIFDGHLGALAWHHETGGGNWDLDIARDALITGAGWLLENLPSARDVIVMVGGDYTETDGYAPLTPANKHLLDVDSRYPKIFEVAEHVIEATISRALTIYRHVYLVIMPGNHDPQTAFALRRVFMRVFADNPRVTVDPSIRCYWAMLHGKSMICAHHGDKAKLASLPGIFAADFAPMWGQATWRICHTGHWHHEKLFHQTGDERQGMTVYQHPTMAARNAWAAGKGLIAARQLVGHSYHEGGGLVTQLHHRPELLEAS